MSCSQNKVNSLYITEQIKKKHNNRLHSIFKYYLQNLNNLVNINLEENELRIIVDFKDIYMTSDIIKQFIKIPNKFNINDIIDIFVNNSTKILLCDILARLNIFIDGYTPQHKFSILKNQKFSITKQIMMKNQDI